MLAASFTFTGLYSSGGALASGTTGADFADFLLGMPQQATLQVGGTTHLHGKSLDAYIEDNWQKSAKLTLNLGLRYELVLPYTDVNGRMANLDAAPGFTAVAPVVAGGTGPYTGQFPAGLINADTNNIGPRVGCRLPGERRPLFYAAVTASPTTRARMRPSRGSSQRSRLCRPPKR